MKRFALLVASVALFLPGICAFAQDQSVMTMDQLVNAMGKATSISVAANGDKVYNYDTVDTSRGMGQKRTTRKAFEIDSMGKIISEDIWIVGGVMPKAQKMANKTKDELMKMMGSPTSMSVAANGDEIDNYDMVTFHGMGQRTTTREAFEVDSNGNIVNQDTMTLGIMPMYQMVAMTSDQLMKTMGSPTSMSDAANGDKILNYDMVVELGMGQKKITREAFEIDSNGNIVSETTSINPQ